MAGGRCTAHELLLEHAVEVILLDRGRPFLRGEQRCRIHRVGDRRRREPGGKPRELPEVRIPFGPKLARIQGEQRLPLVDVG